MARKPNYDFEKRRKELERKAKKEAKQQRRRDNATRDAESTTDDVGEDGVAAPLPAEGPTVE